jgi:hypothetical protein
MERPPIGTASRRRLPLILAVLLAASAVIGLWVAIAQAASSDAVVASGRVNGHLWNLKVSRGAEDKRCFELGLSGKTYSRVASCPAINDEKARWRRVVGLAGSSEALELDLTTLPVRRLRLRLEFPGSRLRSRWETFFPQRLTASQARRAGVDRGFRFTVVAVPSANVCVERVVALNKVDKALERRSVPCEF